jgi:hypothetical protein
MRRLHLDNVAERILKNFQNPGWRKHGGKPCGVTAELDTSKPDRG